MDTPVSQTSADAAAPPADAPNRRTRILLIAGAVILVGGAVWGLRWWTVGRFIQSTDDAYLQADSMTVAPKINGYVAEVFVTDNQAVTAGQPLVRLDNRQYQAMFEQADAAIAARKADIERAEAELLQQEATIVQARAQVVGARAAEAHAIAEVKRYEPLIATGAESGEKLADLRNARSRPPQRSLQTSPRYRRPNGSPQRPAPRSIRPARNFSPRKRARAIRSSISVTPSFAARSQDA
jgi:membrane fusion protein (multidrug efflux system)